jgi:hypothetical protein
VESRDENPGVSKIFGTSFSTFANGPLSQVSTELSSTEVFVDLELDVFQERNVVHHAEKFGLHVSINVLACEEGVESTSSVGVLV